MIVALMQIVTIIVNIYISFTEKKKRIYIANFLLNLSQLIMYFFNDDLTTALIYIVITIRSFVYIYKDKLKTNTIPYIAIIIQILIGYLTIQNKLQIFSILIACYSCWYLWFYNDTQKLRIGNIIANTAWACYNICSGLYIIFIMRVMAVGSNIIAYIKRKEELSKLIHVKNAKKNYGRYHKKSLF